MTKTTATVDAAELNLVDSEKNLEASEPEVKLTSEEETRMRAMIEANVFYGHVKSKTNPKMRVNIASTKSGVEVIDLLKVMKALDAATKLIKDKVSKGGTVLFVGTTPAAKFAVKATAVKLGMPYVTERWLGGTLTNFKTISSRVGYFKKLEEDKNTGKLLSKYTKKERLDIDRELARFEKLLRGIETLDRMPAVVFVADMGTNQIASEEAKRMKIPSVGLVNTNTDPDLLDFPIPANDRNSKSVSYVISAIENAIMEGKAAQKAAEEAKVVAK